MKFFGFAATNTGPREINQDCLLVDDQTGLYLVSDGMGGHQAGQLASKITTESVYETVSQNLVAIKNLRDIVERRQRYRELMKGAAISACEKVYNCGMERSDARGMGATLTALLLVENEAFVAHVGDSRLYLERGEDYHQLTRDHTMVQEMIDKGAMTEEQITTSPFAHVLSRAIGVHPYVQVDLLHFDVLPGDRFILCSDGALVTEANRIGLPEVDPVVPVQDIASVMVSAALEKGATDNVSVAVVSVEAQQDEHEEQEIRKREIALKIESLRGMYMFHGLELSELVRIADLAYVMYVKKGDAVFRSGDDDRSIYLILIGELEVQQSGQHVNTLRQGNHFGEMALLANRNRAFDVVAVKDSKLLQIQEEDFRRLTQRDAVLGVKLLSEISKELGRRLYVSTRVE